MADGAQDGMAPEDAREPRTSTVQLARAVGARLRMPRPGTPLADDARDALAARLAAAAGDAGTAAASSAWRRIVLRRPAALVGALSALVVLVAGVGVVTRTGDDLPVLVLASGAGAGGPGGPMSADARVAPEAMDASPMIEPGFGYWQPTRYTFELADGVTLDVDRSAAWRFVPPDDLAAGAARLAALFGLPAPTPAEYDAASWSAQADDGANLWVSANGEWFYGGPHDLWSVWDCPVIEPREDELRADGGVASSDGGVTVEESVECVAPEPPAGVPSAARARELTLALLTELGSTDVRITDVSADEWSAWVTLEQDLPDGSGPSGLAHGVGFAGEERLASASGTLARLERLGDYPLIGVADALPRLADELNAWLDMDPGMRPMPLPADSSEPAPGDGAVAILPLPEPGDAGDSADGPGAADGSPMPTDPVMPAPVEDLEPVDRTVVILEVELITSMVFAADGTLLLVPHYRLVDAEGGWWSVVAVQDGYFSR